jgi:dTDP-4-dehydrorhamnose reductase/SAM-dependent methyltransferase
MDILKFALITGGSGMIGSNIDFGYKPNSNEMNICDKRSVENYINSKSKISCIIHLAATNLRESDENKKKAIDVNVNGTTNMLFFAMKYNIPFIFLSSGAVFSSNNSNLKFNEKFATSPNSMYGITKNAGEKIALLYEKTILIRTGWLFGGNQKNHYKFVESAINNLITNNEIKASIDFYGSPTYVKDLIQKMKEIIVNSHYGVHHVVNDGFANGYEIAIEITDILNMNKNLIIQMNHNEIPNSKNYRSNTEVLETINLSNKLRSWKVALKDYCQSYISSKLNDIYILKEKPIINEKKWVKREKCRLCNNYNLKVFFNLNPTPPANHFLINPVKQEEIPLDVAICSNCKHIQLMQIVEPKFQYSNYLYVSSTSYTMTNHLKKSVIEFTNELNILKEDNILEIGANDGVCIKHLLDNGFKNVIGIDPAENINKRHDLPIICDFFGSNILPILNSKYNKFKLIYAFHCCAHIEDIQDIFATIYNLLENNGIFVMEVGYFYEVFKNNCFDTIYHEHIDYHTCYSIQKFASLNNLTLFNVKTNNIQGGSIQLYFSKNNNIVINKNIQEVLDKEEEIKLHNFENLSKWKINIIKCGSDINNILNSFKNYGKKIVGYGASAKSTTFLYQYKLSKHTIDYIIDDNIYKQNYYSPGLHIPIKSIEILDIDKVDYIIILSWNFTEEILSKLKKYRELGTRIIIPFPEIKII